MKKQKFGNSYISDCALYLIGGVPGSPAHNFLYQEIRRMHNKEKENEEITYTQVSMYVTQIIMAWEMVKATERDEQVTQARNN